MTVLGLAAQTGGRAGGKAGVVKGSKRSLQLPERRVWSGESWALLPGNQ